MAACRRAGRPGIPEAFALIGAASFLAARFLPLLEVHSECPFRLATGLPCATCGMTHAFVALARGDLAGAWASLPQRAWRALAMATLSAAALNWAWMLWRARMA